MNRTFGEAIFHAVDNPLPTDGEWINEIRAALAEMEIAEQRYPIMAEHVAAKHARKEIKRLEEKEAYMRGKEGTS